MKQLVFSVLVAKAPHRKKNNGMKCTLYGLCLSVCVGLWQEWKNNEIDTPYGRMLATRSNTDRVLHVEIFEHIHGMANMNM